MISAVLLDVIEANLSRSLDFVGQIATFIFAAFIGWFAFFEAKRNSLKEGIKEAHEYFTGHISLHRAKKLYEEYCDFEQSNFF